MIEEKIVWYGPHPCGRCDPEGKKTQIVKGGNGAPDYLEFDFTHESYYPGHTWQWHRCPSLKGARKLEGADYQRAYYLRVTKPKRLAQRKRKLQ